MVDAVGSIAKIVGLALKIKEAANTVHQNEKDCHHIKSRVDILNRTLSHHENNTEWMEDSAVMAALEALDGILAEALEVITKCQEERNIICVYYTAGNLSRQLSKVEQRISYLSSDVLLSIMSYQLLRKFQEGDPHPPPQGFGYGPRNPVTGPHLPPQGSGYELGTMVTGSHPPPQGSGHELGNLVIGFPQGSGYGSGNMFTGPHPPPQSCGYELGNLVTGSHPPPQGSGYGSGNLVTGTQPPPQGSGYELGNLVTGSHEPPQGEMTGEPRRSLVRRIAEVTRNIKEAVETVLQNKNGCVAIGEYANLVSTLLPQLEDTKMAEDPAMRGALEKLLETFCRAHTLVIACQRRGIVIAWLSTAGRLSTQLHEVLDQILSNNADMTFLTWIINQNVANAQCR